MADINRFVDTTRDFAGFVGQKAEDLFNVSKSFAERTSIEAKISGKYRELGKLCYEMHENGSDETGRMKELIGQISLLKSDLKAAEEAGKKAKVCKYCGCRNAFDDSFCAKCGSRLD